MDTTDRVSSRLSELPKSWVSSKRSCTSWRAAAMDARKSPSAVRADRMRDFEARRRLHSMRDPEVRGQLGFRAVAAPGPFVPAPGSGGRARPPPRGRGPCRTSRRPVAWLRPRAARGGIACPPPEHPDNRRRPECARPGESLHPSARPDSRSRPIARDARAPAAPRGKGTRRVPVFRRPPRDGSSFSRILRESSAPAWR